MEKLGSLCALEFRAASTEMGVSFALCVEDVSYQQRLSTLLGACGSDKAVLNAPEVAISYLMNTGVGYGWSLNRDTGRANTALRHDFICILTYRLVGTL